MASSSSSSVGSDLASTQKEEMSSQEVAFINQLRSQSSATSLEGVRKGKITISELMGGGDKTNPVKNSRTASEEFMEQYPRGREPSLGETSRGASIDPTALLDVAGWKVPPLPPGLVSIAHEADRKAFPSSLPNCIFEKTMRAAAIVQAGLQPPIVPAGASRAGSLGSNESSDQLRLPPAELIRLIPPLSPIFSFEENGGQFSLGGVQPGRYPFHFTAASQRGGRGGFLPNLRHPIPAAGHGSLQQRNGAPVQRAIQQNQKTRKPYFMPYMSIDAVNRGLASGDLAKGVLRVNRRNYEESFVDNPLGDDQQDILILGVHDRNRALHGDVVVVRIKDRINWLVRDALYDAWREGHLKAPSDDNGQPITIPPVKAEYDDSDPTLAELLDDLPVCMENCVWSTQLTEQIPVPKDKRYSREQMLCIAAQMELCRRRSSENNDIKILGCDVLETIGKLAIAKRVDSSTERASQVKALSCSHGAVLGGCISRRSAAGNNASVQRRLNYRILADMAEEDWGMPDICLQKTAEVVYICEQKNCRAAVGVLKIMADGNRNWALFSPGDSRMPRMMIPADQMPAGFFDRPQDFAKFIYVARLIDWQATDQFARGKLYKSLGLAGDIESETDGLLLSNDIDTREFSQEALASLPVSESVAWSISETEFKYRRDFREETVYTIDPMTARDMDDALHICQIDDCDGNGTPGWEVGVHIADVSFFVNLNTELDKWASERATSVYLVHKVIPMLPRILCEELCSLNPGVDRLTFSVVWKMNDKAEILEEWFGRSIIRSCCKLAYEHAQDFIEHPDKDFTETELPKIYNNRKPSDIKESVLLLNKLAVCLRDRRCGYGSLRLDQPKLCFSLGEENGMPNGVRIFERKEAHSLIEEFMLLANMAVARKIECAFPKTALLRRHPPPKMKVLRDILEQCEKIGFPIDGNSSKTISSCLRKFEGDDELKRTITQVLSHLLMKSMQLAVYFCTGCMKSKDEYRHYALSVPFYTHFTSPIRRYPDIMVHRMLSTALGYTPQSALTVKEIEALAEHCNDKKLIAKTVSEASDDMFFGIFVKECGPLTELAVVLQVLDASFDVLVVKYGVVKRVYANRLRTVREPRFVEGASPTLTLFWDPRSDDSNAVIEQVIRVCSIVEVILSALPEPTKYQAIIKQSGGEQSTASLAEAFASQEKLGPLD